MSSNAPDFWTNETSVLFTSFWGWSPETWGAIGWTGTQGLARRTALLQQLTDPFIAIIYITKSVGEENLRGKIAGFYLVSHETGHRDDFTHPTHHDLAPEKWVHSLRAIRAFSFVPEYCIRAAEFDPSLAKRALSVAKWCEELTDRAKIDLLRKTPWLETSVYQPADRATVEVEENFGLLRGFNRAGPANRGGYVVSSSAQELKRELYILRLTGNVDVFLGRPANGKQIYKIGLSFSPELRKQCLQSTLPEGAFRWVIHNQSSIESQSAGFDFEAAVAGEYAMKVFLANNSEWLGGEFYLASNADISAAWALGKVAANAFQRN